MPDEYGILIYDVPEANVSLYRRLYKSISKQAIRMNLSVYLLPWGMKQALEGLVAEAEQATGQMATVRILKFDTSTKEEIETIAKQCLQKEISDLLKRLNKKIVAAREESKEIGGGYFNSMIERLKDIEALAVIFGFEGDISGVTAQAREMVKAQTTEYFASLAPMIREKKLQPKAELAYAPEFHAARAPASTC